jgi:hypothetical protein
VGYWIVYVGWWVANPKYKYKTRALTTITIKHEICATQGDEE